MSAIQMIAALLAQAATPATPAPAPAAPAPAPAAAAPAPAPAPAPAAQWETMFEDDGSTYQIDPASIGRDGDTVSARVRNVADTPSSMGVSVLVIHSAFNCRRRTSITFSMEGFTTTGESLGLLEYPENERRPERMGRGPADRALFERVCPRRR